MPGHPVSVECDRFGHDAILTPPRNADNASNPGDSARKSARGVAPFGGNGRHGRLNLRMDRLGDVKSNALGNDLRETKEMDERVSLSLSEPNKRWIQAQIDGKQFSSRSEVLNDLIRKARATEVIRTRLKSAERSVEERGWVTGTPEELLDGFKEKARRDPRYHRPGRPCSFAQY